MEFLEISQNSQERACARVYFLIKLEAEAWNFVKKETLAQVFFCKSSKNTFSYRTPPMAASYLTKEQIIELTLDYQDNFNQDFKSIRKDLSEFRENFSKL